MGEDYKMIGNLKSGEAVYLTPDGSYAVEKDYECLVLPTEGEAREIEELVATL